MNNLNVYALSSIFKFLNLQDLFNCSRVCKKWNEAFKLSKPKDLFFCYGTKFSPKIKKCLHQPLVVNLTSFSNLHYILDNTYLNYLKTSYLEKIETFVFYGNGYFVPPDSFNLYMFPNLKYVEIKDSIFCNFIVKNFEDFLEDKKINPSLQWKFFSPSIETLIMDIIDLSMLLIGLTNIKHIVIKNFLDHLYDIEFTIEPEIQKWETFVLNDNLYGFDDQIQDKILDFLMFKCPLLKSIKIGTHSTNHLEKIFSNYKLKNICIKLLISTFEPQLFKSYEHILMKYKNRFKSGCNLCINYISIKLYDDILYLSKNSALCENAKHVGIDFGHSLNFIRIQSYPGFDIFKSYLTYDFLKEVIIDNHYSRKIDINNTYNNNLGFSLKEIFKFMPKTIKSLSIFLDDFIDQNTFDLIPQHFPNLEKLFLKSSKSKIFDCSFISELKFLNKLHLLDLTIDCKEMVNAFEKLDFLTKILIYLDEKKHPNIRKLLKKVFNKKNFSVLFKFK